jgi:hypothetical protein
MTGQGNGFCVLKLDDSEPIVNGGFGQDERLRSLNETFSLAQGAGEKMKEANKMPNGNGTGPNGMGPLTGRGAGYCAGSASPGYANGVPGRGLGRGQAGLGRGMGRAGGRGMGYGRQAGFSQGCWGAPYAAPTRDQELEMLKSQSEGIQGALKDVQQRIQELESAAGETKE